MFKKYFIKFRTNKVWVRLLKEIMFVKGMYLCSRLPAVYREPKKKNENQMSLWGALIGRFSALRGRQPCCCLTYPHHPPKQIKSDTDQAPAGAPASAFVRAPGHNANCDQEAASLIKHWGTSAAQSSYFIQTVDGVVLTVGEDVLESWYRFMFSKNHTKSHAHLQRGERTRSQLKAIECENHTRTYPLKHRDTLGIRSPFWSS